MSTVLVNPWIELESITNDNFSNPVKISNTEWVIITDDFKFIKYTPTLKKWQMFCDYKDNDNFKTLMDIEMGQSSPTISYDNQNNKYYIFSRNVLVIIDQNNNGNVECYKYIDPDFDGKIDPEASYYEQDGCKDVGITPCSIFIDGKYHIIGGYFNKRHIIFDTETKQFDTTYTFNEWVTGNSGPGLLHVTSRNELILFGGFDEKRDEDGWIDTMWRYSLKDNKWSTLNIKLPHPMCDFAYLLTNDEKYIVTIHEDKIDYLNLDTMVFKRSDIKCPKSTIRYAMIEGNYILDEIVASGFIRDVGKIMHNDTFLPQDIIRLIMNWYICEYVQILDPWSKAEVTLCWEINIRDIIPRYN